MATGLITQNVLRVKTDIGICQIELCVGDITKLQKEDKVDVLVVSAFPGDYSPTPSSLIGQLQIKLGVSVRNLSKDKEEDLRRQYFCWWSRPLPEHLSYGRLLCFEGGFGSRGSSPPKVIGAVFRCLVPILKNKEGSVIMSLLSSGDQGYSKKLVLKQLLKAAVNWMKAGLPLRTLKIVIFSSRPEKEDTAFVPLFQLFEEYKAEVESKDLKEEKEKDVIHLYDIYLSHCTDDHNTAQQVKQFLKEKEDLIVFDDIQELNDKESWQDNIYNTMVRCSRVVTLLSPGYLSSENCIEQYNMAMCISRKKHTEVLAPFYVTTVEYLPTYMGLMQYIDCRPQDQLKLKEASLAIQQWLEENKIKTVHQEQAAMIEKPLVDSIDYEVFISYSHCNKDKAYQLLESLKICDPNLKVFIDTAGLKTGTSWQQSIFHAIDETRIMVALLSEDYFKSKVCKEEFSLAFALHLDDAKDFKLVTLLVENVKECPLWCSKPRPVDCTSHDVNVTQLFPSIANGIINSLRGHDDLEERLATLNEDRASIDEYMQRYRKTQFVLRKCLLSEPLTGDQQVGSVAEPQDANQGDPGSSVVALSFAEEDVKAALTMKQLLIEGCPTLEISEPRTNATSRLKALDVAKVIIIMLSPAYINSKELVEELNIALYRHRSTPHQVIYPIQLSPLPIKPSYIRLLPCDFAAMDYSWIMAVHGDKWSPGRIEHLARANHISNGIATCLLEASELIVKRLTDAGFYEEHTHVILNNLEVQKIWNEIREQLAEKKGLHHLKLSFGVKVTSDDEHDQSHHDAKSVGKDGNNDLAAHSSNYTEKSQKVAVEQDETADHGSVPLLQGNQSGPDSVGQVAANDVSDPEVQDHGQGQDQNIQDLVGQDLHNQTSGSGQEQNENCDLQNNPSGKRQVRKGKAKSCSIL